MNLSALDRDGLRAVAAVSLVDTDREAQRAEKVFTNWAANALRADLLHGWGPR